MPSNLSLIRINVRRSHSWSYDIKIRTRRGIVLKEALAPAHDLISITSRSKIISDGEVLKRARIRTRTRHGVPVILNLEPVPLFCTSAALPNPDADTGVDLDPFVDGC